MSNTIHLTLLTGPTLCGAPKEDGGTYWRAMYCKASQLQHPDVCIHCLDVWYGIDDTEEG